LLVCKSATDELLAPKNYIYSDQQFASGVRL